MGTEFADYNFFKGSMKTIHKFKMLINVPCLLSFSQFSKSQLLSEFKHFSAGAFMTRQYRFIDFCSKIFTIYFTL